MIVEVYTEKRMLSVSNIIPEILLSIFYLIFIYLFYFLFCFVFSFLVFLFFFSVHFFSTKFDFLIFSIDFLYFFPLFPKFEITQIHFLQKKKEKKSLWSQNRKKNETKIIWIYSTKWLQMNEKDSHSQITQTDEKNIKLMISLTS